MLIQKVKNSFKLMNTLLHFELWEDKQFLLKLFNSFRDVTGLWKFSNSLLWNDEINY